MATIVSELPNEQVNGHRLDLSEVEIDPIRIVDNHHVRSHIDPDSLEELTAAMKAHGVEAP
jgi:ParB-like chromosome segregation protein Spo0J